MTLLLLAVLAGAILGFALGGYVLDDLHDTDDVVYRFQVNGQVRYEPELPEPHERDSGPVVVYYGYEL